MAMAMVGHNLGLGVSLQKMAQTDESELS